MSVPIWNRSRLEHPLVRCSGLVLGKTEGDSADVMAREVLSRASKIDWHHVHVWQRDTTLPGKNNFEPSQSVLAEAVSDVFRSQLRESNDSRNSHVFSPQSQPVMSLAKIHEASKRVNNKSKDSTQPTRILDVILVKPSLWWIGCHSAENALGHFPGGIPRIDPPENMISRAYLKVADAIYSTELPIGPKDSVVEIGSSPGGACQFLLEQGIKVCGIDPAEMDEHILQYPNFTHWQSKSLQVKRKAFARFNWLLCDASVGPNYTMKTVEEIVNYPENRFLGLILTIKLSDYSLISKIPEYIDRIRNWGFADVRVRQLAHSRREVCIVAQSPKST